MMFVPLVAALWLDHVACRYEAEQAFLREYYRADVMLLPYKYNLNLAQLKHEVSIHSIDRWL